MDNTADGTLNFDTKIDSSGFSSGTSEIGNIVKGMGIANMISQATNAVVDLGKKVVTTGMGFQSSMSQVAATMGITTDEIENGSEAFNKLSSAAKKMGATTQFSASNAADALNYLALAGYDVDEAIETLPQVLNLAAAGGMNLDRASDMLTDAMSALGMETQDASKMVDQMAKTSQKSNTSVSQLGDAILTVGGTAKVLKGGITEMNTVLGVLADNGKKGAEGGTVLRNMILSLTAPTDNARQALTELGVSVFDAEGQMRSMPDIIMDLGASLEDLTEEEKQVALSKIFNKADIGAVNSLLGVSAERWEQLANEIENSKGTAEEMAATMNDNLAGALTQLGSALEGLAIEIYERISGGLQDAVEIVTGWVSQIVQGMQENGVAGGIEAAGNIVSGILSSFAENGPELIVAGLNMATNAINGLSQGLPQIMAKGSEMVTKIAKGIISNLPAIVTAMGNLVTAAVNLLITAATQFFNNGAKMVTRLGEGLKSVMPNVISAIVQFVQNMITTIINKAPEFLSSGVKLINSLLTGIKNIANSVIEAVAKIIKDALEKIKGQFSNYLDAGKSLIEKVSNGIKNTASNVVDAANSVITQGLNKIKSFFSEFQSVGKSLIEKVGSGISNAVSVVTSAARNVVNSIKNAFNIDWSSIGANIINGIKNGITSLAGSLADAAASAARSALDAAKSLLGIHSPSKAFEYLGKMSDEGMALGFEKNAPAMQKRVQGTIDSMMDSLRSNIAFVTSSAGTSIGDIDSIADKSRNIGRNEGLERLIKLQEQANRQAVANSRKPVYLGTQRIDRNLPKGAVPAL